MRISVREFKFEERPFVCEKESEKVFLEADVVNVGRLVVVFVSLIRRHLFVEEEKTEKSKKKKGKD